MIDKKPPCRPHEGKEGMAQLVRDVMTRNPVDLPPMPTWVEVEAGLAWMDIGALGNLAVAREPHWGLMDISSAPLNPR
jgi:hypothetical protein